MINQTLLKVFSIVGVAVAGASVGIGAGLLLGYATKPATVLLGDIDLAGIEDEELVGGKTLLERYDECKSEGKDPTKEFELYEIANIAQQKFASHPYGVVFGYGRVNTAVNLDIRNIVIHDNGKYMEESVSKSDAGSIVNVHIAQRDIQYGLNDDDIVESYDGDCTSDAEHPDWSNLTKEEYTVETFSKRFGKSADNPNCYVISSKTVLTDTVTQLDSNGNEVKGNSNITKNSDGTYTLYMDLHTVYGVPRYYYRMVNLSGSTVSAFNYVRLTYTLDEDFNFIKSKVEENYVAGMGNIKATATGVINSYYFVDTSDFHIPEIHTALSYPEEGKLYA